MSKPTAVIRLCTRRTGRPLEPFLSKGSLWSASSMLIQVTRPTMPSTVMPLACWNALTGLGLRPELAVDRTGIVAQRLERLLQIAHRRVGRALLQYGF